MRPVFADGGCQRSQPISLGRTANGRIDVGTSVRNVAVDEIARSLRILQPEIERVDAQCLRDLVRVHFLSIRRLQTTEAPELTGHLIGGVDPVGLHGVVGRPVGADQSLTGDEDDGGPRRGIPSGVSEHLPVLCGDGAVLLDAPFGFEDEWMTGVTGAHLLIQGVLEPNRPTGLLGEDGCVELIEILIRVIEAFAAEPTANVVGVDVYLRFRETQRFSQDSPGREDTLLAIPDMKVVALPGCRADVRLDRQRDLPTRPVASFNDQVGVGKSRLEVPDPRFPRRHVGRLWAGKSADAAFCRGSAGCRVSGSLPCQENVSCTSHWTRIRSSAC